METDLVLLQWENYIQPISCVSIPLESIILHFALIV